MGVHFGNVNDVLDILRDVYTYIIMTRTHKHKDLSEKILSRINIILKDNDINVDDRRWKVK